MTFFGTDAEYKMKDSGDLTVTAELPENGKLLRLADRDGRQCTYPETQENLQPPTETI